MRLTKEQRLQLLEAYNTGATPVKALAADFGVDKRTVYRIIKGSGIARQDIITAVRAEHLAGAMPAILAVKYDRPVSTIWRWLYSARYGRNPRKLSK